MTATTAALLMVFLLGVLAGSIIERLTHPVKPVQNGTFDFNRVGNDPLSDPWVGPNHFNMDKLWAAICQVESGGYQYAYNKKSGAAGIAQIKMICLLDCNDLVGAKRWSHEDRFDALESRAMFGVYIRVRCPKPHNYEKISRTWRGGPQGYYNPDTLPYWEKVKAELQG